MQLVLTTAVSEMRFPIAADEELRLRFRHSVYGSTVEEAFVVGTAGFDLRQLRYGEARLADYYGHDHSRRVGDLWVVDCEGRRHQTLSLRVSAESEMTLSFGACAIDLRDVVAAGGAVRVSVDNGDGRVAGNHD